MSLFDGGQRCLAVNRRLVVTGHNDGRSGVRRAPVKFPMRVFPTRVN